MAFFDKISQAAKNIGDKTTDAFETTKLNSKINAEKNAAGEEYKKIGEFYYNIFANGGEVSPEVMEFCRTAKSHLDAAAEAQAEIDRIKAENEAAKAPAVVAASGGELVCGSCGAANAAGTRFCQNCGSKLEAPPPAPVGGGCPNCGTVNAPGTKFCCGCGTKLEEAAPAAAPQNLFCTGCGTQLPAGTKFCNNCGQRLDG